VLEEVVDLEEVRMEELRDAAHLLEQTGPELLSARDGLVEADQLNVPVERGLMPPEPVDRAGAGQALDDPRPAEIGTHHGRQREAAPVVAVPLRTDRGRVAARDRRNAERTVGVPHAFRHRRRPHGRHLLRIVQDLESQRDALAEREDVSVHQNAVLHLIPEGPGSVARVEIGKNPGAAIVFELAVKTGNHR
jgi:hypothetical protein